MSGRHKQQPEEPAETLPPNPSVGELVTEIDRARHQVGRTAAALADKMDVKKRAQRATRDRVQALRWDSRRLRQDLGIPVLVRLAGKVPPPVLAAAAGVLVVSWLIRRRRQRQ
jgi:uncharacterized protein (TIGR03382 family)